jgi:hypothetical protein
MMADNRMITWDKENIDRFMFLCNDFAATNPGLVHKANEALNDGVIREIARLKEQNSDMAMGMITALELTTPKVWNKSRNELTRFIGVLADWFKSAPIEKKLRDWLKEGDA